MVQVSLRRHCPVNAPNFVFKAKKYQKQPLLSKNLISLVTSAVRFPADQTHPSVSRGAWEKGQNSTKNDDGLFIILALRSGKEALCSGNTVLGVMGAYHGSVFSGLPLAVTNPISIFFFGSRASAFKTDRRSLPACNIIVINRLRSSKQNETLALKLLEDLFM